MTGVGHGPHPWVLFTRGNKNCVTMKGTLMSEQLNLQNLHKFDGGTIEVLFNRAIERVYYDLSDRPNLNKPRRVTIELTLVPRASDGELDTIATKAKVKEFIPTKETRENFLLPSLKTRSIQFDPDSAVTRSLPGQPQLDFGE